MLNQKTLFLRQVFHTAELVVNGWTIIIIYSQICVNLKLKLQSGTASMTGLEFFDRIRPHLSNLDFFFVKEDEQKDHCRIFRYWQEGLREEEHFQDSRELEWTSGRRHLWCGRAEND